MVPISSILWETQALPGYYQENRKKKSFQHMLET